MALIRLATVADIDALTSVDRAARLVRAPDGGRGHNVTSIAVDVARRSIARRQLFVAEAQTESGSGGRVVGWLLLADTDADTHPNAEVGVAHVVVHPEHRRQGVGTALLLHVVDWARLHRASSIVVHPHADGPIPRAWFERLGFRAETPQVRKGDGPDQSTGVGMRLAVDSIDHFADVADVYDDATEPPPTDMIKTLTRFANDHPVDGKPRAFELAIGTGRVALPLAETGVEVVGVDISAPMLEVLDRHASPLVTGVEGDMATTSVVEAHGRFGVAYLVFNTIMNLTTQAAQVDAFRNAAAHLVNDGVFIVEVGVPSLWQLEPGSRETVFADEPGYRGYDEHVSMVDQHVTSHHQTISDDGTVEQHESTPFRWVWPAELDLMAQLAGLRLIDRWGDWDASPFTDASPYHVSIYQR